MTNRLDLYTQGIIRGIFTDIKWMYTKEIEWVRDLTRLLDQLGIRGIKLVSLEFPAALKHLDRCLDEGRFTNPHLPLSRPKRRGEEIPVFLREIFLRVFTPGGESLGHPCVDAVLALRTIYSTFKSIRLECPQGAVENEVKTFFSTDAMLPRATLQWHLDDMGVDEQRCFVDACRSLHVGSFEEPRLSLFEGGDRRSLPKGDWDHIQRCFDVAASKLGLPLDLLREGVHAEHRPRHGPGVVANLPKGCSKYELPHWPTKLQRLFPRDEYALPSFGWGFSCDRDIDRDWLTTESPSRLIAVPKTLAKPRLIAAEPVEYQWIQQALFRCLETSVSRCFLSRSIDFRKQGKNSSLALSSSDGGSHATVDLSEASDRVSTKLVETFFRANPAWIEALHACRTRYVSYGVGPNRRYSRLNKFATMGSTVTFPLQTIIFSTIAIASVLRTDGVVATERSMKRAARSVHVFGDDIILRNDSLGVLRQYLTALGLKVNESKTFNGSYFRESCGVDAFRGYNVTPPRVREVPTGSPSSLSALCESSNNFHKAGFWHAAMHIQNQISEWAHLVPISGISAESGIGLASFTGSKVDHLKARWNADLQRTECRVFLRQDKPTEMDVMTDRARLVQYFTEQPDPSIRWKSGTVARRVVTNRPGWCDVSTLQ